MERGALWTEESFGLGYLEGEGEIAWGIWGVF